MLKTLKNDVRFLTAGLEGAAEYLKLAAVSRHQRHLGQHAGGGTAGKEVFWALPSSGRILQILRNPCYGGAFAYGKTAPRMVIEDGRARHQSRYRKPQNEWKVLLVDHHPGYISGIDHSSASRLIGTPLMMAFATSRLCDGECCHEDFLLRRNSGMGFCKTAFKPYDLAVTATLLIANVTGAKALSSKVAGRISNGRTRQGYVSFCSVTAYHSGS